MNKLQKWLMKLNPWVRVPLVIVLLPFLVLYDVFALFMRYVMAPIEMAIVVRLPIKWQRWHFKLFQKQLKKKIDEASAIVAYPFAIFVELELPKHFEEGGMRKVKEEVEKWFDRFSERAEKTFAAMGEQMDRGEKPSADLLGMGLCFDHADPDSPAATEVTYGPGPPITLDDGREIRMHSRITRVGGDTEVKPEDLQAAVERLNGSKND